MVYIFPHYSIKLPLFTILNDKYYDGIPTIKMLTNKVFYDPEKIIEKNISKLYKEIIMRLIFEKGILSKESIYNHFINLIKKKDKLSFEYIDIIKKEIRLNN